jgi:hypothetical protein
MDDQSLMRRSAVQINGGAEYGRLNQDGRDDERHGERKKH